MKISKIKSKKGFRGWKYRFTSPVTHRPTERRFYVTEPAVAQEMFKKLWNSLQREAAGLCGDDAWKLPYADLVSQFLKEAPITSPKRKADLRRELERNPLGIETAQDFNDPGRLTSKCVRILEAKTCTAAFLKGHVQRPLKQLSRWCFDAGILPTNPLARWRKLPFKHEARKRRAYAAGEVQSILAACRELDANFGRKYPLEIVLRTLVTCGNRPGVMLRARIADLEADRLRLPPGDGRKRNGVGTLPPELVQELRVYTRNRSVDAPLFVSADGAAVDGANLCKRDFRLAVTLAVVKGAWPNGDPAAQYADPLEVAAVIAHGTPHKFDGGKPTDPAKIDLRAKKQAAIDGLVVKLAPLVKSKLDGRDLYAFTRKTHITLARANGVHPDAVNAQTGHSDGSLEEKFYLDGDQLNPAASSRMVYGLICPARAEEASNILRMAAGAEGMSFRNSEFRTEVGEPNQPNGEPEARETATQVSCATSTSRKAISGIRTQDLCFTKALLYH